MKITKTFVCAMVILIFFSIASCEYDDTENYGLTWPAESTPVPDEPSNDDDDDDTQSLREDFVKLGQPLAVSYMQSPWKTDGNYLVGTGNENILHGLAKVGNDQSEIYLRLAVRPSGIDAPALLIAGNNEIHFLDSQGRLTFAGPLFPDDEVVLEESPVVASTPFEFGILRNGADWRFEINGHVVLSVNDSLQKTGTVGLCPGSGEIRLVDFWAEGDLLDYPEPPFSKTVFQRGEAGYSVFRIPALIATPGGSLIAFAEARRFSLLDFGVIDLVYKRSDDDGLTWSDLQVLAGQGFYAYQNPVPIIDPSTQDIVLVYMMTDALLSEQMMDWGLGHRDILVTRSTDDGQTWQDPVDITPDVLLPEFRWHVPGPGHGIAHSSGRLIVPCDHTLGQGNENKRSHVIFSDDGGLTWELGGIVPSPYMNECMAVELENGDVMLNMRSYRGKHRRAVSISTDRGKTWSDAVDDSTLIEPVCQASILRASFVSDISPGIILFANPANSSRSVMAVRASFDDGATWPEFQWLHLGPSAYSDMTMMPDGQVGLLYEKGDGANYERITFAKFPLGWVMDNE